MPISPTRYLRILFFTVGGVMALITLFNYVEDPFGIYHYDKSWDWIHSRPDINSFVGLHKAYAVRDAKADVLFLGDSRVYNGLDPHYPALPSHTYNLATPGSRVYENLRYLEHAASVHVPTTVVMGIDLRFFGPANSVTDDFSEDRLNVQANGRPNPYHAFVDLCSTLVTAKALECSFDTLLARPSPAVTYDRGYEPTWSQLQEHFDQVQRVLAFNTASSGGSRTPYLDKNGHSFSMDAFKEMLHFCASHQIHLIVFVLPLHASALDAVTTDWRNYCSWMQAVLTLMESEPGLKSEFWDFAGYNAMSTEAFTQPPARLSQTRFYWESSHFKKSVGDLVLSRLFTNQPSSFGRRVTLVTLSADEARLQAEKENWHSRHQLAPLSATPAPSTLAPVFR